jgi:hypothetical protein
MRDGTTMALAVVALLLVAVAAAIWFSPYRTCLRARAAQASAAPESVASAIILANARRSCAVNR